jgi:lipoprotein-anchoring transpeptidase ErfK/SrfK
MDRNRRRRVATVFTFALALMVLLTPIVTSPATIRPVAAEDSSPTDTPTETATATETAIATVTETPTATSTVTSTPTATATPDGPYDKVRVILDCSSNPETTRIENIGSASFTVQSISSLVGATTPEPITINRSVAGGRALVLKTGQQSGKGGVSAKAQIYEEGTPGEGARVVTSLGEVIALCTPVEVVDAPARFQVTLDCGANPEKTTIKNIGTTTEIVSTISSLYQPGFNEPFTVGYSLAKGASVTFVSGSAATSTNRLTSTEIYDNAAGDTEGAEVVAGDGEKFTAKCPAGVKWIEINLSNLTLYMWQGSTLISSSRISSGKPGFETPTGTFYINKKLQTRTMSGCIKGECYTVPNVPWVMYFTYVGHAIHGAYWHNQFGIARRSHGCINLPVPYSETLYNWTPLWTKVVIHY